LAQLNQAIQSVGICLGSSSISLAEIERDSGGNLRVLHSESKPHYGKIAEGLLRVLHNPSLQSKPVAITGRNFRHSLPLPTLSEPEAVELAFRFSYGLTPSLHSLVSAGGEAFIHYRFDHHGHIESINTGNKCASGSGEFFLQQINRLGFSLENLSLPDDVDKPYKISGRCSVFCKSDCTHALNKGVSKGEVLAGLNLMMANRVLELLDEKERRGVILIGGCSNNKGMVAEIIKTVSNLDIPAHAGAFEALGAAIWSLDHGSTDQVPLDLFNNLQKNYPSHPPLSLNRNKVRFLSSKNVEYNTHDSVVIGLDVGSTTTKAVVLRREDKTVLASAYLRTNGDPIAACRKAYLELDQKLPSTLSIEGLGVTGSGRHLCALHANTQIVVNEIVAHARAAIHFDPQVDTIFEIGGQDAKYTLLHNAVANDYVMNEACSAGTGSFLEEAAKEALGIETTEISSLALHSQHPINFNDQCSAFISSDIKIATQNNVAIADILAGLVYSVCLNYLNRVKSSRPLGRNIFMQGGVCYNHAVPIAMSALTGATITVPPDPGLMGALGAALVANEQLPNLPAPVARYHLKSLAERDKRDLEPFTCAGDTNRCDLKCTIMRFEIDGKVFPFGGACSKYERHPGVEKNNQKIRNLVSNRQQLLFQTPLQQPVGVQPTIGMNRSFLINTYFPFFYHFFHQLGYQLILPNARSNNHPPQTAASFCFPVEIAHTHMELLLLEKPDFIFLPHILSIPGDKEGNSCTCVFIQSEPSLLKSAFPCLKSPSTISPTIDMRQGLQATAPVFHEVAAQLGHPLTKAVSAFEAGLAEQKKFEATLHQTGIRALSELTKDPQEIAIVLFGRPYNSFVPEANKGIHQKIFGKNIRVIPFDMVPCDDIEIEPDRNMFWGIGRRLLKAAKLVSTHPQLYGVYITNFSCGPDSFILSHFRDIMGNKPSLILEVDSHTADAGLDTRIEAFLEIAKARRGFLANGKQILSNNPSCEFIIRKNRGGVKASNGDWMPLTDPQVRLLIPAMGRFGTPLFARSFQRDGIRAIALPPADREALHRGRANTGCKECLPMQTTVGSLLSYLEHHRPADEISLYFMPTAPGPCRFGQYHVLTRQILADNNINNVAILSPSSKNCYGGLSFGLTLAIYRGMLIGDLFDEMYATLLATAQNPEEALIHFDKVYSDVLATMDKSWPTIIRGLKSAGKKLAGIALSTFPKSRPVISLVGEIYVRHDPLALQQLIETLARRGFILRTAPNTEWIKYLYWLIRNQIMGSKNISSEVHYFIREQMERKIRSSLLPSGLLLTSMQNVEPLLAYGSQYLPPAVKGEAILTIGSAFHDIVDNACGVISIGPFGCMPARIAEAILTREFTLKNKFPEKKGTGERDVRLPFLAIETDGQAFPQVIEAKLEAFCLQARRVHEKYQDDKDIYGHGRH